MPGGNDSEFNALYQIACQTGLMADGAGGAGQASGFSSEDDLVFLIACNLRATVGALGGPCDAGWVNVDDAWTAILFYSAQLTGLTGTDLNALGIDSIDDKIIGSICNLGQVATNTGQEASGILLGSYLQNLNALGCVAAQIAANGFGPIPPPQPPANLIANAGDAEVILLWNASVGADSYEVFRSLDINGPYNSIASGIVPLGYTDTGRTNGVTYFYVVRAHNAGGNSGKSNVASATPISALQAFINNLLPFAPDLLVIADSFIGIDGAPVASAPDSSGNNNPMVQVIGSKQPTLVAAAVNGKNAYNFDGVDDFLQCPFPSQTKMCSIAVVAIIATGVNGRICTVLTDAAINLFDDTFKPSSYYGGGVLNGPTVVAGTYHACAGWLDGTNAHLIVDGAPSTPIASTQIPNPAESALIGGALSGAQLEGRIAFHARWATAPSNPDITAFLSLVNSYYGL